MEITRRQKEVLESSGVKPEHMYAFIRTEAIVYSMKILFIA
jgi:hypothetical protein